MFKNYKMAIILLFLPLSIRANVLECKASVTTNNGSYEAKIFRKEIKEKEVTRIEGAMPSEDYKADFSAYIDREKLNLIQLKDNERNVFVESRDEGWDFTHSKDPKPVYTHLHYWVPAFGHMRVSCHILP